MKTITLPTGEVAMVDDEDFERLSMYRWQRRISRGGNVYVQTSLPLQPCQPRPLTVSMHRFIINPPAHLQVDHRDTNGLNNCRYNLRVLTLLQNMRAGKRKQAGVTSRYRGVYWEEDRGKWRASIGYKIGAKTKCFNLGRYDDELEAARSYNAAAVKAGFFPEALNIIPV